MAEKMYEYIISRCKEQVTVVERGKFGADMKVSLVNDGRLPLYLIQKSYNQRAEESSGTKSCSGDSF